MPLVCGYHCDFSCDGLEEFIAHCETEHGLAPNIRTPNVMGPPHCSGSATICLTKDQRTPVDGLALLTSIVLIGRSHTGVLHVQAEVSGYAAVSFSSNADRPLQACGGIVYERDGIQLPCVRPLPADGTYVIFKTQGTWTGAVSVYWNEQPE